MPYILSIKQSWQPNALTKRKLKWLKQLVAKLKLGMDHEVSMTLAAPSSARR